MEEEARDELCIAELFRFKGKKNKKTTKSKKTEEEENLIDAAKPKRIAETVPEYSEATPNTNNGGGDANAAAATATSSNGVRVSLFDYSVENFFRYNDTVATLCGEEQDTDLDHGEIRRISSSVTFLREWRDFKYPSRSIGFAYGLETSERSERKDDDTINLPPFSSASVPQYDMQGEEQRRDAQSQESRDFVMHVGGLVWALDWCPQIHEKPDCSIKCEFIAVATHPPGSSYHKMGAPLTGRGVIQIWCVINIREEDEDVGYLKKGKKRPNKEGGTNDKSTQIKRPRGRPRKNPIEMVVDDTNSEPRYMPALAVEFPENSADPPAPGGIHGNSEAIFPTHSRRGPKRNEASNEKSAQIKRPRGRPKKNSKEATVGSPNCENQSMQVLAIRVPEDSAEFISSDSTHGNCNESPPQQSSVAKQKHTKKAASACSTIPETPVRPRRRPKKNSKEVTVGSPNCENQSMQALAVRVSEDSAELISSDAAHVNGNESASQQSSVAKQKRAKKADSACSTIPEAPVKRNGLKINHKEGGNRQDITQPLLRQGESESSHQPHCSSGLGLVAATDSIPGDVALPRVVSCLAHNGKVAWDVKWRPSNMTDSLSKHRMGYLAVLLGNGSLEVWEVPLPRAQRAIYTHREGTDPRFIKLEPVFRCSMLKRDGIQSIPLTVEWSVTAPHDYLLAGCHDGTVALWKFSTTASSKCDDTKPVLCFSGDTVPIRAIAWAPFEGDPESSNVIATAGHEGLKFWDLRNPFRPLRSLQTAPRIIYSLDWLSKPSCIIMSLEDGTIKTISLVKAANELPVSGKSYNGKKQPGLHSFPCSSFAIWSVQVSRITGMVAFCCVDGTAIRYQLTAKAVETDDSRNRAPCFLCGSMHEEESTLVINSPVSNTRFQLKKPIEKGRHAQSFRELLHKSNLRKCANNEMAKASNPDSENLALCDVDDLGMESGSEEALSDGEQQPKRPKSSCSKKKKQVENASLRDDAPTATPVADAEKSDFGNVPEVFPPKTVALHRVRWNMNKGSERWLCFGGAGGIVRCQEIIFSDLDKKWALKR